MKSKILNKMAVKYFLCFAILNTENIKIIKEKQTA